MDTGGGYINTVNALTVTVVTSNCSIRGPEKHILRF
jgi:hypothetical protein